MAASQATSAAQEPAYGQGAPFLGTARRPGAARSPPPLSRGLVLRVQTTAGNAAVGALLKSRRPVERSGPAEAGARMEPPAALREAAASRRPAQDPAPIRQLLPGRRRLQRSVNSPAGGCGICYGDVMAAGTAAHQVVQAELLRVFGDQVLAEEEILRWGRDKRAPPKLIPPPGDENSKLDLWIDKAQTGFLDMAVSSGEGYLIGEIKPANPGGVLEADKDLLWYEQQLEAFGFTSERLAIPPPPMSLPFIDPLAPQCPQELKVIKWPKPDGIYLYYCEPDFKVLKRDPRCKCKRPPSEDESAAQAVQAAQSDETSAETRIEPELAPYREAIDEQLVATGMAFQPVAIVAPEDIYIRLIGEPRAEKMLDRMRFHGLDPQRNPVMGFHNLWVTMLGLGAAAYGVTTTVVVAPLALEMAGGTAAGGLAAAGTTTGAAGGELIPLFRSAAAAAEPIAKAAGVLLVVWTGSQTGAAQAQTLEVGAISAVPLSELEVTDPTGLGLGASVAHNGERLVVVGFAGPAEGRP